MKENLNENIYRVPKELTEACSVVGKLNSLNETAEKIQKTCQDPTEEKMKRKTYYSATSTAIEIDDVSSLARGVENRGLGGFDQYLNSSKFRLPTKNLNTPLISNDMNETSYIQLRSDGIDVIGKSSIPNSSVPSEGKLCFDSVENFCSIPIPFRLKGNHRSEKNLCTTLKKKIIPKYSSNSTIPACYGNKSSNANGEKGELKYFPRIRTQKEMLTEAKSHSQKFTYERYKGKNENSIFPNQGQSTKPIKSILVEPDDQRKRDYDFCGWFPECSPLQHEQRQSGNQRIVKKTNRKVWFDPHSVESRGVRCTQRNHKVSHFDECNQYDIKHFPSLELAYTDPEAEITSLDLEHLHSEEVRPRLISLPVTYNAESKPKRAAPKLPKLSLYKRTTVRATAAGDRGNGVESKDGQRTLDKICIDKCENSTKKKILIQKQHGLSPLENVANIHSGVTSDTLGNGSINFPVTRKNLVQTVNPIKAPPPHLPVLRGLPGSAPCTSSIRKEGLDAVPDKALDTDNNAHKIGNTTAKSGKAVKGDTIHEKFPDSKTKHSLTANLRQVMHVLSNTHYPRKTNLPVSSLGIKSLYHIYGRMFTGLAKKEYRKRFNMAYKSKNAYGNGYSVPRNKCTENVLTNDVLKNVRRIERELKWFK